MTATAVAADRRTARLAALALVAVTAIWGSTFAISKDLIERLPVTDYLGLRFLVAAAVVAAVRPRLLRRLDAATVRTGVWLGLLYAAAQLLQFVGLQHTSPSASAFVVSLYVVFTPLMAAVLLRSRPDREALLGTALATVGVAVMSLRGGAIGSGELLTAASAAIYAAHILAMARWSRPGAAFALTFVQLLTMGAVLSLVALEDGLQVPAAADVPAFLYLTVIAAGVALLVQTWAQGHLPATQAAVLMVLEPVWAALFALILWSEQLGLRTVVGGLLILSAMLLVVCRPSAPNVPEPPPPVHP